MLTVSHDQHPSNVHIPTDENWKKVNSYMCKHHSQPARVEHC